MRSIFNQTGYFLPFTGPIQYYSGYLASSGYNTKQSLGAGIVTSSSLFTSGTGSDNDVNMAELKQHRLLLHQTVLTDYP